MRKRLIAHYRDLEDGAITVDWVLLAAGTIGLAIACTAVLGGAAREEAASVSTRISAQGGASD